MSEFTHSEILFAGDDGLPLEFNVQYAKDKAILKPMIEHGGGICTLSDDAIYLVSSGTSVLNVNQSKNLVTTSYIYECVNQNYLLDTGEFRLVINELETSDISDTSQNLIGNQEEQKYEDDIGNDSVDIIGCSKTTSPEAANIPNSNHNFDFLDSENPDYFTSKNFENIQETSDPVTSVQHVVETCDKRDVNMIEIDNYEPVIETCDKGDVSMIEINNYEPVVNAVPDSLENRNSPVSHGENQIRIEDSIRVNNEILNNNNQGAVGLDDQNVSVDPVIVSSSQPNEGVLDQFDDMILRKVQVNPVQDDDECLSQSYTVSSSADAQKSPPRAPTHNISAEIFDASAPDSASQTTDIQQYINDIEKEVEQILLKPSPKSIQDKITLVKYVCTAKQLPLAVVLQTLQRF